MKIDIENNQKTKPWKKWLKRFIISTLTLFLVLILAIATLINFVFTPEKLTPELVKIVNKNISGKFHCKSAELTFFSSFPNFGITINEGKLISEKDTLLLLNTCNVSFNLKKILLNKVVDIKNISVNNAYANVNINKNGDLNWDILKKQEISKEDSPSDYKINELYIKRVHLDKIKIKYTNQITNDLFSVDTLSTNFKLSYDKEKITCTLNAAIKKIKFVKEGFILLENTKAGIDTEVELLRKEHKLIFKKGGININEVDLLVNGFLQKDTITNKFATDLKLSLKVPDLKSALDLIPEKIIQKEKIDVKGEVTFLATVKGYFGKGEYPLTEITSSIKKGQFQYVNYPGSINHIATDLKARIDFKDKKTSHFTISHLDLKGFGIDMTGNVIVSNLILNPYIETTLKGKIDITKLNKVLPFDRDVTAQGKIDLDIETAFNVNEIKEQDISSLLLKGNATIKDVTINVPKVSLSVKMKELYFNSKLENKKIFSGKMNINKMLLQRTADTYLKIDHLKMDFLLNRALPEISELNAKIETGTIALQQGASIRATLKGGNISANLQSNRTDKSKASISSDFKLDSLGVYVHKQFASIKGGKYKIIMQRNIEKKWKTFGGVHFDEMMAYSPTFGMPLKMQNATLTLKEKLLELRNTKMTFGKSDVTLNGSIDNIRGLLSDKFKDEKVTAKLNLKAGFIDANELMSSFNKASNLIEKDKKDAKIVSLEEIINQPVAKVTDDKKIVKIPKNIDFFFDSNIQKLKYGTMEIDDIKGAFIVKDGKLKLSNVSMKTIGAELSTNLNYAYLNEKEAEVTFELNLNKVEIGRLSEMLPVLDSLFPMTKSFEGLVDFRIKGISKMDQNLELKTPTIKVVAAMQAKNIMLFDSETFRELAKTFMFKSKEKNPIESLNIEMIINDSKLEVLPSLIALDRYELAVGGIQKIDMSYDYHISVLKSQIPFKAGVDVKGTNFENYKIKLSKAKYKSYFTDNERLQKKADSTVINKKANVLKSLNF